MKRLITFLALICCVFFSSSCGFKTIAETDYLEYQNLKKYNAPQHIRLRQLIYFESEAIDIVSSKKDVCVEETQKAEQFLKDLRTFNASLPDDRKILRDNGKLIFISKLTYQQEIALIELMFGSTGIGSTDEEFNAATKRIVEKLSPLRQALDLSRPPQQN